MRRAKTLTLLATLLLALGFAREARAIQGCTLQNPDRDIRRLFPESTDYRTSFIALSERGGAEALERLAQRLGEALDPVYEAVDLPYAYYEVMRGDERIGYVFGVNQKGRYGGMQIILATDLEGKILEMYYQKIASPARAAFVAESFAKGFAGLRLDDFYFHRGYRQLGMSREEDKVARLASPAPSEAARFDFAATLRGVHKALILHDTFWLAGRAEPVFRQVQEILRTRSPEKRGDRP